MRERIEELMREARMATPEIQTKFAIGLVRVTLQHAVLTLAEWVVYRLRSSPSLVPSGEISLAELRAPSDGTLVDELLHLSVVAENIGWAGLSKPLWRTVKGRPAAKLSMGNTATLEAILRGYVAWRNEDVFGHGLPGELDAEVLLDLATLLCEKLDAFLPTYGDGERFVVNTPSGETFTLNILRPVGRDLVCYRNIRSAPNGRCVVRAQRQVSLSSREDVSWEAEDIFSFRARDDRSYSIWDTGDPTWCPLVLVPGRLTHQFTGRKAEINELTDWLDDVDSRACMLYGDGGMGKTTLALEVAHRLLDGSLETKWRPDMITFYTAKQTRWGLDGLEQIRGTPGNIVDLASEVFRNLAGTFADRTWYDKPVDTIISKLSGYLAEWGIDRKRHLLILDNTETMAGRDGHVKELASHVLLLTRRVGRVLLTSRRREPIEARQIEVPQLLVEDSVALLRSRALQLSRGPVLQAGDAKLRQIASKLGNRPLVLEVFIQTLRDERLGLDRAFDRVMQMERQDLGEFLYADAWGRLSARIQALLLLMTRVSDVHDEALMKLCCQQASVSRLDAEEALAESRGIAGTSRVNGHIQIVFSPDFLQFAMTREVRLDGTVLPSPNWVETVRRRYLEFVKSKSAQVRDRVSVAYRTPFARMAWQAFKDQRFEECENAYEMAVVDDPDNGLLFDRYAYFLFTQRRFEDALAKSREASRLSPSDAEVWFTRGLIEGRLGHADNAEQSLARARELGKPPHLCYLQLAYAHSNASPVRVADGFAALIRARQLTPVDRGDLEHKHLAEIRALEYKFTKAAGRKSER